MKKLSLIGLFVLLSCSEAEKTAEPVVVNYTISVVATCPSTNKTSYCVTKAVNDVVRSVVENAPKGEGCIFVEFNTMNDGIKKGYYLSSGVSSCK